MSCRKRKVAADLAPPPHDPFLIATSLDSIKPDAKSRKFIRRYVAKGKRPNRPVSRKRVLSSWFDDKDRTYQGSSPVLSLCKELATEILEPEMLLVLHDCANYRYLPAYRHVLIKCISRSNHDQGDVPD